MAAFDGGQQIDGLLVEEIDGEVLVVNAATSEAHALNGASAAVFALCDGATTRAEMATLVAVQTGLPVDTGIVDLALAELVEAGIATLAVAPNDVEPTQTSRRQMLRRLGLVAGAAAALPLVETIAMRPAAAQGSAPPPPPPGPDDINCQYRVEYGPCSVACGGDGVRVGTYIIQTAASGNGAPCPSGTFSDPCNQGPCPTQCQFHFDTGPCNNGTMTITQVIDAPAQNGGGCPTFPPFDVPC